MTIKTADFDLSLFSGLGAWPPNGSSFFINSSGGLTKVPQGIRELPPLEYTECQPLQA